MSIFSGNELRKTFHSNNPYEHVVIDDFLENQTYVELKNEIIHYLHTENKSLAKSRDYMFARNKFEIPHFEVIGNRCAALHKFLLSEEFGNELSDMWGRKLIVDPTFHGGGVHAGGKNSFLDMHTDFAWHPNVENWRRRLNILLYLNADWKDTYGGQLKLRHLDESNSKSISIEPLGNRLVVMRTDDYTVHGYDTITFPDGEYRISIACYAYEPTEFRANNNSEITTKWYPSQGSIRKAIAPVMHHVVGWKKALFGSKTGTNKKKK
jgi:Rps23 Pro-64 3,4-dihydroxylase Tpa1-like proline 4-hydroxylase